MHSAMGLIDGKQVWLKKMRGWVVFLDLFLFLEAVLEYAKGVGIGKMSTLFYPSLNQYRA